MGFITILNEKLLNKVGELNTQIKKLNEELGIINDYIQKSLTQIQYQQFGYQKESEVEIEKKLPTITGILTDISLGTTIRNINSEDIASLKDIVNVIDKVKEYIKKIENEIKLLNLYNKIFTNPNAKLVVFDMNHLFKTLNSLFDKDEDINKGLGIIISHNSKFMYDNVPNKNLMRQLSRYYKKEGSFKENVDYETYKKLMGDLLLSNFELGNEETKLIKEFITNANELLKNSNEASQTIDNTNISIRTDNNILNDEEFELISLARNLIENSVETEFTEIRVVLGEIDYLFSSLDKITDEEEKEYYQEELRNLVDKLRELYSPYRTATEEVVEENNFIFLLDGEYNSFIESDTNKFEGNQRRNLRKIFEMISKIKTDEKMLPILPLYKENPVFYKEYNSVGVAFSKLSNGKYLIIGAWGTQPNHKSMNNRASSNLSQITRLKKVSFEDLEEISREHYKYYQQLFESKKDRIVK